MLRRNRIKKYRVDELLIHPLAQRKLVPAQLKKRMEDLDLDAIGVLHGVDIDGTVYIIDGQHRVVALKRHGFDDWPVEVMLHPEAEDPVVAHRLFLRLNARTSPSSYDTYVNELGAGDEVAVGAEKVVTSFGMKTSRQSGDGHVACVSTLKNIYSRDGGETLSDTFKIVSEAWGDQMTAYEGKLIEGVAIVVGAYNGELDKPALVKKLAKYPGGPGGVLGDAKGLKKIRRGSVARCVAETVVEAYNLGRREANRIAVP